MHGKTIAEYETVVEGHGVEVEIKLTSDKVSDSAWAVCEVEDRHGKTKLSGARVWAVCHVEGRDVPVTVDPDTTDLAVLCQAVQEHLSKLLAAKWEPYLLIFTERGFPGDDLLTARPFLEALAQASIKITAIEVANVSAGKRIWRYAGTHSFGDDMEALTGEHPFVGETRAVVPDTEQVREILHRLCAEVQGLNDRFRAALLSGDAEQLGDIGIAITPQG